MLLTEEEAKTKWCPHIMYCQNPTQVSSFEAPPLMVNSACVASLCMAWRWSSATKFVPGEDEFACSRWEQQGYCGLSGRPTE